MHILSRSPEAGSRKILVFKYGAPYHWVIELYKVPVMPDSPERIVKEPFRDPLSVALSTCDFGKEKEMEAVPLPAHHLGRVIRLWFTIGLTSAAEAHPNDSRRTRDPLQSSDQHPPVCSSGLTPTFITQVRPRTDKSKGKAHLE